MISDIEIFAHYAQAPVIAITGSNGKSTVCAMLKSALVDMGKNPALGGNFGILPCNYLILIILIFIS